MDIELLEQIIEYLRNLAEPAVSAGWNIMMKQVQYQAISNLVGALIGILGSYGAFRLFIFGAKKKQEDWNEPWEIIFAGGVLLSIVSIPVFFICLFSALNAFINPEWLAIQMILSAIGK